MVPPFVPKRFYVGTGGLIDKMTPGVDFFKFTDVVHRIVEGDISGFAVGAVGLGDLLTSEGGWWSLRGGFAGLGDLLTCEGGWWSLRGGFAIKEYDGGGGAGCNGTVQEVFVLLEQFDHRLPSAGV